MPKILSRLPGVPRLESWPPRIASTTATPWRVARRLVRLQPPSGRREAASVNCRQTCSIGERTNARDARNMDIKTASSDVVRGRNPPGRKPCFQAAWVHSGEIRGSRSSVLGDNIKHLAVAAVRAYGSGRSRCGSLVKGLVRPGSRPGATRPTPQHRHPVIITTHPGKHPLRGATLSHLQDFLFSFPFPISHSFNLTSRTGH